MKTVKSVRITDAMQYDIIQKFKNQLPKICLPLENSKNYQALLSNLQQQQLVGYDKQYLSLPVQFRATVKYVHINGITTKDLKLPKKVKEEYIKTFKYSTYGMNVRIEHSNNSPISLPVSRIEFKDLTKKDKDIVRTILVEQAQIEMKNARLREEFTNIIKMFKSTKELLQFFPAVFSFLPKNVQEYIVFHNALNSNGSMDNVSKELAEFIQSIS